MMLNKKNSKHQGETKMKNFQFKIPHKAELAEMKRLVMEEGKSIDEAHLELYKVAEYSLQEYYLELSHALGRKILGEGNLRGDWHDFRLSTKKESD